jgi:hypothetical protein
LRSSRDTTLISLATALPLLSGHGRKRFARPIRAPRTAAPEGVSSGDEAHGGVSLADQQTKDQRRYLQTRANNNAEFSCSAGLRPCHSLGAALVRERHRLRAGHVTRI